MNSNSSTQVNTNIKRCGVCGGQAVCFNFDGLTCGPCRLFFYRNVNKAESLKCHIDEKCEISFTNRRCCRKCRMNKCFEIGMKSKNNKTDIDKLLNQNNNNNNELTLRSVLECEELIHILSDSSNENLKISLPKTVSKNYFEFNQTEAKYIDELLQSSSSIFNFEEANLPVLYEASTIYQAFNLGMNYVRRIIKFCKSNSVFRSLSEPEQMKVLKQFFNKFLKIRSAFAYDAQISGYYALGNEDGNCSVLNKAATLYSSSTELDKVKQLVDFKAKQTILLNEEMENDKTIRDLLIVQALYSCDLDISIAEALRYHFWIYNNLMLRYLQCKYKNMQKAHTKYSMLIKISHNTMNENRMKEVHEVVQTLDRAQFDELAVEILNI